MRTAVWILALGMLTTFTGPLWADPREAAQIVATAIKASGGEVALRKAQVCVRSEEGARFRAGARELSFTNEITRTLPDKIRAHIEVTLGERKIQTIAIVNRDRGWLRSEGATKDMARPYHDEMREEAVVQWQTTLLPLLTERFKIDTIPGITVEGEETNGIRVEGTGYVESKMYFYKKSGLLASIQRRATEAGMPGDKQYIYTGYKVFDGGRFPSHETHLFDGKKVTELTIKSYKYLDRSDDTVFDRP
jgi:hypothetical protein